MRISHRLRNINSDLAGNLKKSFHTLIVGDTRFLSATCRSNHAKRGHVLGLRHSNFLNFSILLQLFIEYSTKP